MPVSGPHQPAIPPGDRDFKDDADANPVFVMRKALFVLMGFAMALLLAGCAAPQPESPAAVPPANVTPASNISNASSANASGQVSQPPVQPAYIPLNLQYRFPTSIDQNGTEREVLLMDYYWDRTKDCNGKKAVTGIAKAAREGQDEQHVPWFKTTIYLDDGSFGMSKELGEGDLLFDGAIAQAPDLDLPFMLEGWFASSGRNFRGDAVWNETSPTILKNVNLFNSLVNLSIVKGADKVVGGFPCTEFSVGIQGGMNGPGGLTKFCILKNDTVPVPIVVSMYMEGGGPRYDLKKLGREAPPVQYFPECMAVISCTPPTQPGEAETNACNARNGSFDQSRDANNCISSYVCRTNRERAVEDLSSGNCGQPGEGLIQKYMHCRWEQNGNWDLVRDQRGCATDVICR